MSRVYTNEDSKLAVAYIRVDRWGESAEVQRNLIDNYADRRGYTIQKWYQDEAGSEYDRLDWDEATDAVRRGPVYRLLYTSVDRLGASLGDMLDLWDKAIREGWRLEGLDATGTPDNLGSSDAPVAKAAFCLAANQAELEANLRKEGRHSMRFTAAEMQDVHRLIKLAEQFDPKSAEKYAKRFRVLG